MLTYFRQSGTSANSPQWARWPRPHARAELTSPAPGGLGTPAVRQSGARALGTVLVGGGSGTLPWRAAGVPPAHRGCTRLISNVNQNSFWLMFDINHQAGGYWFMIDIHLL